jgi:hypothetical protein
MFLRTSTVVQTACCCPETRRSSRGAKASSSLTCPSPMHGSKQCGTAIRQAKSSQSQRKLPRELRSRAEVAAVSAMTCFLYRERVFFGADILFVPCSGGGSWVDGMAA